MATLTEPRPQCRIIAYNAKQVHTLRTVNVSASQMADARAHWKEYLQVSATNYAKDNNKAIPTFMAAAATTKGLPTIYVNGYTGPS